MQNRRRLIGFVTALVMLLFVVAQPFIFDGTLAVLIDEPWTIRALLADPVRWAKQARCRHQQREAGESPYTIACVCSQVQQASSGAGFWSTKPGCLNP